MPGVAANVQSLLEPDFISNNGVYKPYRIFVDDKTGDKVGLVGLVTDALQTASPNLLDANLALTARQYGELSWNELSAKLAAEPAQNALLSSLKENTPLQKLIAATPDAKMQKVIEKYNSKFLQGMSSEARDNWNMWFKLAGEKPDATLKEIALLNSDNKTITGLAALYPDKRIGDLRQVMVSNHQAALEQAVKDLQTEGVNKVVVLSHLGKRTDLELAKEGPRVAAIIGGHSHDLEPRPLYVQNAATGSPIFVSQAGQSYGWLGESNLVFNKDGSVNRFLSSGKMHVIDEEVAALPSAKNAVMTYMKSNEAGRDLLQQAEQRHPVQIDTEVSVENIRGNMGNQTPLANLLLTAYKEGGERDLAAVNADRSARGLALLGDSIDAVLVPSGVVRAGIPSGQLDELSLQSIFMDSPTLLSMKGSALQKALAFRIADMPAAVKPEGAFAKASDLVSMFGKNLAPMAMKDTGKMVLAGQMRFSIDRSLPPLQRLSSLEIFDSAANKFVAIDPQKNYTVMTASHLLRRMAMSPAPGTALGASSSDLGADSWVFGKRLQPDTISGALQPSKLPASSARNYLLDYLTANSRDGRFQLPAELLESPMKDISPDAWIAQTRPSLVSSASIAGVAALDEKQK